MVAAKKKTDEKVKKELKVKSLAKVVKTVKKSPEKKASDKKIPRGKTSAKELKVKKAIETKEKAKKSFSAEEVLAIVKKVLDDGKAQDITVIELEGKSSIADYMVVASGTSQRQVVALAEKVAQDLKSKKIRTSVEGKSGGEWVIVDAADVIVHVFYPETRAFYSLEEMWKAIPVTK